MKKEIKAELISIAHRILQLKDPTTLGELQEEAQQLYEKLTILHFAETHFTTPQPTIGQIQKALETDASETPIPTTSQIPDPTTLQKKSVLEENTIAEEISHEHTTPASKTHTEITPEKTEPKPAAIKQHDADKATPPEFVIDKVNAAISEDLFVPATAEEINAIMRGETIPKKPTTSSQYQKNDLQEVTPDSASIPNRPKSLNDTLKKNITIGLNDRLAFIKYLFDGSATDYNRVLSQLNTIDNSKDAIAFIQTHVKPDHNNWLDKEEYEERFMKIVNTKFD